MTVDAVVAVLRLESVASQRSRGRELRVRRLSLDHADVALIHELVASHQAHVQVPLAEPHGLHLDQHPGGGVQVYARVRLDSNDRIVAQRGVVDEDTTDS